MKKFASVLAVGGLLLSSCSVASNESAGSSAKNGPGMTVEISNCGVNKEFTKPESMWANDANLISIALAAGARDKLKFVSSLKGYNDAIDSKYGGTSEFTDVSDQYPGLEEIVARHPDLYLTGWGYGLDEAKNITPETLKEQGIESYILSESCRRGGRTMADFKPWEEVAADITNIAELAGDPDQAQKVIDDIKARRDVLATLPAAGDKPSVFLFDSGQETLFTSGAYGGPQAIFDAVGIRNATEDIADTWTTVSWEKLVASNPDAIAFVDYPGQSFEEKVQILEAHPVARELEAVKKERFINLPYAMWTAGPMNIDAAEHMRAAYEHYGLLPHSDMTPELTLPSNLAGRELFGA